MIASPVADDGFRTSDPLASIPFALGWLVLLPVLAGSAYASYRDVFLA